MVWFFVSETCYRYEAQFSSEHQQIANWLLQLATMHKRWGFGLCILYLCNVKGYGWNYKRVYRIYRELELNLAIKPKRRIRRDYPGELDVPSPPNQVSVDGFYARSTGQWQELSYIQRDGRLQP